MIYWEERAFIPNLLKDQVNHNGSSEHHFQPFCLCASIRTFSKASIVRFIRVNWRFYKVRCVWESVHGETGGNERTNLSMTVSKSDIQPSIIVIWGRTRYVFGKRLGRRDNEFLMVVLVNAEFILKILTRAQCEYRWVFWRLWVRPVERAHPMLVW